MIACVCPGSSSADHTLNTLRYSDRLKDRGDAGKAKIGKNDFDLSEVENFDDGPKMKAEVISNNLNNKPMDDGQKMKVEVISNNLNNKPIEVAKNIQNHIQLNNSQAVVQNNQGNMPNNMKNNSAENVVKKNSKQINQERPLTENRQQNNKNAKGPAKKNSQEDVKIIDKKKLFIYKFSLILFVLHFLAKSSRNQ